MKDNFLTKKRKPFVIAIISSITYIIVYSILNYITEGKIYSLRAIIGGVTFFIVFYLITKIKNKKKNKSN